MEPPYTEGTMARFTVENRNGVMIPADSAEEALDTMRILKRYEEGQKPPARNYKTEGFCPGCGQVFYRLDLHRRHCAKIKAGPEITQAIVTECNASKSNRIDWVGLMDLLGKDFGD
jgi:hypothetical protein